MDNIDHKEALENLSQLSVRKQMTTDNKANKLVLRMYRKLKAQYFCGPPSVRRIAILLWDGLSASLQGGFAKL